MNTTSAFRTFLYAPAFTLLAGCSQAGVAGQDETVEVAQMATTSPPPAAYQNVQSIQVLCLLQADDAVAAQADTDRLCSAVEAIAGQGVDLPVAKIALGDPKVVGANRLTLLVHASLTTVNGQRMIALSVRPYRADADGAQVLFGATPRIAQFDDDTDLNTAVSASLDSVLPWRGQPTGVRKIQ